MESKLWKKVIYPLVTVVLLYFGVDNLTDLGIDDNLDAGENTVSTEIVEEKFYDSAQEVTDYIHLYGELPDNYLTKEEARDLGWISSDGNLWDVAPGQSIGGDHFGNFEGELPDKEGRNYREADINYQGGYRDGERLVFSNDGLYFYTEDHYKSFEKMEPVGEGQ